MDSPTSLKKRWTLTKTAFDGFLAMLDQDREEAGQKYERIRVRLVKYFQWRGAPAADLEADETINRVARKIEEGETVYNFNAYIYGVAKLVLAESFKGVYSKHQVIEEAYDLEAPRPDDDPDESERRTCLDRCLASLSDQNRDLIIEYYQDEKHQKIERRRRLAAHLGVSPNALRISAHRIRVNLEACVRQCLRQHP